MRESSFEAYGEGDTRRQFQIMSLLGLEKGTVKCSADIRLILI